MKEFCPACECDPCDCGWGNYLNGLIMSKTYRRENFKFKNKKSKVKRKIINKKYRQEIKKNIKENIDTILSSTSDSKKYKNV